MGVGWGLFGGTSEAAGIRLGRHLGRNLREKSRVERKLYSLLTGQRIEEPCDAREIGRKDRPGRIRKKLVSFKDPQKITPWNKKLVLESCI